MSLLASLSPARGSNKANKRRGRGDASGLGGTAGKGHKGQKARTGGHVTRGFEGGQMPIHRKFPKFGFHNPFRVSYTAVNIGKLEGFKGEVNPETLKAAGFAKSGKVKLLGTGKLTSALTCKVHAVSAKARELIEKAGGKIEVLK